MKDNRFWRYILMNNQNTIFSPRGLFEKNGSRIGDVTCDKGLMKYRVKGVFQEVGLEWFYSAAVWQSPLDTGCEPQKLIYVHRLDMPLGGSESTIGQITIYCGFSTLSLPKHGADLK
jgi:hypothetical protein